MLADIDCWRALDVGSGTGFLALELARRGRATIGIDLAPEMVAIAQRIRVELGLRAAFTSGDAERLPFVRGCFDLVVSRHLHWTLPHPDQAVAEWVRVARSGGRVAVLDGHWNQVSAGDSDSAGSEDEYAAILQQLPLAGGSSLASVEELLDRQGLVHVRADPLDDLCEEYQTAAPANRRYPRYLVWGNVPG